jgi:uncharacterized protein (TIRG00374 family)
MDSDKGRWWQLSLILRIIVSLLLFAALLSTIDFEQALPLMANLLRGTAYVAVSLTLLQYFVGAVRWHVITLALHASVGFWLQLRYLLISYFIGQVLPSTIGSDAVRVLLMTWRGVPAGKAFAGVLLDRMMALVALVALFAALFPWVLAILGERGIAVAPVAALVTIALAIGAAGAILLRVAALRLRHWRLLQKVSELIDYAFALARAPGHAAMVLALSIALHFSTGLLIWIIAQGLGVTLPFVATMVVIIPIILLLVIPISISGWGVREAAVVVGLGQIGVAKEAALAIGLSWSLVTLAASLLCGLVLVGTSIGPRGDGAPPLR